VDTTDDPRVHSLQQTVHAEHHGLTKLLERIRAGLGGGADVEASVDAFVLLRDEFEAHLVREEQLYFPPIWALRPQHKSALLDFIAAHDQFRNLLGDIETHLDHAQNEAATDALDALVQEFADHERSEEHLLHRVTDELLARPD